MLYRPLLVVVACLAAPLGLAGLAGCPATGPQLPAALTEPVAAAPSTALQTAGFANFKAESLGHVGQPVLITTRVVLLDGCATAPRAIAFVDEAMRTVTLTAQTSEQPEGGVPCTEADSDAPASTAFTPHTAGTWTVNGTLAPLVFDDAGSYEHLSPTVTVQALIRGPALAESQQITINL